MARYRKRAIEIEAIQFTGDNFWDCATFIGPNFHALALQAECHTTDWPVIQTLEGNMTASPGDWIIRGVKGECYPCKDEIFRMTYEPMDQRGPGD